MFSTSGLCGSRRNSTPVKGPMNGSARRGRDRLGGGGGRRTDGAGDGEHLVLFEQLLDRFDGSGRLIAVVDALELELAALDAAGLVDFGERRVETRLHALAERRGRTFERRRLAEHDLVGGDTVLGESRNARREQAG